MTQQCGKSVQAKKPRQGARGARKVKTGCQTCKTRHKKCDERRPECSRCLKDGWRCDFVSLSPVLASSPVMASSRDQHPDASSHIASHTHLSTSIRTLQCPSARSLTETELLHMEYFHLICAKEFALFFDLPVWEDLILQQTHRETFLHHAALAIGALSRSRYHPLVTSTTWQLPNAIPFSIRQYGLAIQTLHSRLQGDQSIEGLELAALASVVFSQIEFLLGMDSQLEVHLRAGCAVLEELGRCDASSIVSTRPRISGFCGGGLLRHRSSYPDTLLSNAILQLSAQVDSFKRARRARL